MPFLSGGGHRIRYELRGPASGPAYVLVNGLTQYAELWSGYCDTLVAKNFRVLTFDLLGQGESDKPSLFINQDDQVAAIGTLAGLVQMNSFAQLSPQLLLLGNAMRTGLILGGTSYLQDLLLPMNLSDAWLGPQLEHLEAIKRQGWLINDVYALQNLMDSFLDFEALTDRLGSIRIPTMILNGDFDFLTPRSLHETLRANIPDSALIIIPLAYHAFTLEKPALTAELLAKFAADVLSGQWKGGGSVWIAPDEAGGEVMPFPSEYDHLRAIPVRKATT